VHAFQVGNPHILRHLCFRDYLITHPAIAEKYGALKLQLAKRYPNNRRAYVQAKEAYVKKLEQQALQWVNRL
jgi:GrpB-like predicted nucleotidyltransferase (UPF0157 family)